MRLDSAGRLAIGSVFPEWKSTTVFFYLSWHKRTRGSEPSVRILLSSGEKEKPDSKKQYIGSVKCDSKGRIAVIKILNAAYGDHEAKNFLIYRQRGNLYIERE